MAADADRAHRDALVLAVDGGNFKTDLALLDASGVLLSHVRGGGSNPHNLGVEGCVEVLETRAGDGALEQLLEHFDTAFDTKSVRVASAPTDE